MALSPNYSWAEPDNSSLVKNGAQDIRALGDAIDTSVWNIGFGQAGKNKIINGDFGIWQRGTSFTATAYTADRWYFARQNTTTLSQQTFTAGAAPVAGYEGNYYCRLVRTSGSSDDYLIQRIEDVRTFAGQTATISFWAKADTATTISEVYLEQNFGSGGSSAVGAGNTAVAITSSWARYSVTVSVPSISGKTIGTSSFLGLTMKFGSAMGNRTIDVWGVQLEYGSKATPFQTATGSIQGELAACQRYYFRTVQGTTGGTFAGFGRAYSTTLVENFVALPVPMRVYPTSMDYSNLQQNNGATNYTTGTWTLRTYGQTTLPYVEYVHGTAVFTAGNMYNLGINNGYIGFSAEL